MIDPKKIDELVNSLSRLLPPGLETLKNEFKKNAKTVIQKAFEHLDLVNREEFDVQAAVLARTREKLEAMEQQLAELERQLNIKP